ncbi:HBR044Cp [Eremothecium sinecaudum]|uniref:Fimbrin n=1 Tax=Eremothecium sinecaudum TaxID=45286 RepID=A0A120K128_9SACH|nr:HBR044Cp [Eremothecium sinecaudum]AMD18945.1 HBR044Cp [Eremothecium sinecaudum]
MNVLKLQKKFPQFTQEDLFSTVEQFRTIDSDDKGYVEKAELLDSVSKNGIATYDDAREALKRVNIDASGRVELDDYVELIAKLNDLKVAPRAVSAPTSRQISSMGSQTSRIVVEGSTTGTTHTINEEERREFTKHINSVLAGDPDLGNRLPFPTDTFQVFDDCRDGLVLSKLINDSVPDTIDTRVLNWPVKGKPLNNFTAMENANVVINSAKAIGCVVVNVHSEDIIEGKEHLILGLIWQIIRRGLLSKIDIKLHPELYRLLEEDETLEQFLRLPPEKILLRWFNYHLANGGWHRRVANFSSDIADGENYTILLNQLAPELCSRAPLQTADLLKRAEQILDNAEKLQCRKYLTPTSLIAGNPKLNLAFVAHLFNTHPGLEPVAEDEKPEIEEFDAEGEREARVFTLWLNSLDVNPPVVSLFEDLRDGLVLLCAYDKVMPGCLNAKLINQRPTNGAELSRFKSLENANYAVALGKSKGFSLVGIDGSDIVDGNKLLTLGLVWQLMRRNIVNTMTSLASSGRDMSDSQILKWAQDQVIKGGKSSVVRSFQDPSLGTSHFLLDVLNGIAPGYVDYDMVAPGKTDEEKYANARLAISIARKLGALIWLVPEDINEIRSRLILTFVASLMALKR